MKFIEAVAFLIPAMCAALPVRAVEFAPGDAEIVLAADAKAATRFAAEELRVFVGKVFGKPVPVVAEPGAGRKSIVLGDSRWSREAGISLDGRPRDAFIVKTAGDRVYIVGDDSDVHLERNVRGGRPTDLRSICRAKRGTVFGVYEFLERFAGCRFYFPGELGEVVPSAASISVPDGTLVERAPTFTQRSVSLNGGPTDMQILNWIRLRLETEHLQCGHGLNSLDYVRRFAASHPEYFCLMANGRRAVPGSGISEDTNAHSLGQLCHTSGVWDEIEEDVLSYFRGEPGERRLGKGWGKNFSLGHADLMPQDGMWRCRCDRCSAAYADDPHYASELIWGNTCRVARRIRAEGLQGRIAQMAYSPYARVPAFDIPDNVDVMVATAGPWSMRDEGYYARSLRRVEEWRRKIGRPVWLWTYPGKVNAMDLPAAPQVAPRAWGEYYKRVAKFVFGAYNESESDSFMFNYLNYYVFSRVAWDVSVDVGEVVSEHHRLMYGKGAPDMARLFDRLEDIWLHDVIREDLVPAAGGEPTYCPPGKYDLLVRVYSRKTLRELFGLVDAALAKVEPGSLEARRIGHCRDSLLMPIATRAGELQDSLDVGAELARRKAAARIVNVPVSAKWRCSGMSAAVDGDELVVDVVPGGKTWLPLSAAGVELKPGTRYRATCFMETDLCDLPYKTSVKKGGGLLLELAVDSARKCLLRETGIYGKRPRETHGFEFTTGENPGDGGYFRFLAYGGVKGRVRVGGVAVYEVAPPPAH